MSKKTAEDQKKLMYTIVGVLVAIVLVQGIYLQFSVDSSSGERLSPGQTFKNIVGRATDTSTSTSSISNSPPVISAVVLQGGTDITLVANDTLLTTVTFTITDDNGCEDMNNGTTNASVYYNGTGYGLSATDTLNNQSFYQNITCANNTDCTSGGSDLVITYSCHVNLTHYAIASDGSSNQTGNVWNVSVQASDGQDVATLNGESSQDVNTLSAIEVYPATLAFGSLAAGVDTGSTNTNATVYNLGNEQLDISLDAYGLTDGDLKAMDCTLGNISGPFLEYSSESFTYDNGTGIENLTNGINITDTATQLDLNVTIGKGTTTATQTPNKTIAFGLEMPTSGIGGNCSGFITFTTSSDPTGD